MTRATVTFVADTPEGPQARSQIPAGPGWGCAVMAHRGASRDERENTLEAFRRAVEVGSVAVELDVRRTRDGVLVVHHDPHIGGRAIIETTRVELPGYVPNLAAALDACQGLWVNVEIKNDPSEPDFDPTDEIAAVVASELLSRNEPQRFLVSSFRRETIDCFRQFAPGIATAWLTPGVAPDDAHNVLGSLSDAGHSAIHPWFGLVNADLVRAAHEHGLMVNVWTCDDPEKMRELAEFGVDGICTNVPDVAIAALESPGGSR